jgi:hypothetical protein
VEPVQDIIADEEVMEATLTPVGTVQVFVVKVAVEEKGLVPEEHVAETSNT